MILGMRAALPGPYVPPVANILYWGAGNDLQWGAANQLQWG